MTVLKFKHHPAEKTFNNLMDGLLPAIPSFFREDPVSGLKNQVPVNIRQTETAYLLDIIAPGMKKEDFNITMEKELLTVSAEHKGEEVTGEKRIRSEYTYPSFKRSFTVDKNIDSENISAQYVNGVLTLNLPRKAEVKASAKQITIQ
jgi:HSP20 family protein